MTEITATEAARGFSTLLDKVEHDGETFVIIRGGRRVATLTTAPTGSGKALKDVLRRHHVDEDFARDVVSARALMTDQMREWPD